MLALSSFVVGLLHTQGVLTLGEEVRGKGEGFKNCKGFYLVNYGVVTLNYINFSLGLDSLMGVEVRQTLERDFDIQMSMKDVRLLTVNKMRDLTSGGSPKETDKGADRGRNSEEAKLEISLPEIGMQSLVHLNDVKNHQKPLFVIHNINGTVEPLRTLARNLSCPVFGLQYTVTSPKDSIQSLSASYIQCIRDIVALGPYRLAGYSFGACVAIEMALQLEKTNEVESLILLDGSHKYVEARTVWHRNRLTVEQGSWESSAVAEGLCTLAPQYAPIDKVKLLEALQRETSIEKQVQLTASAIAEAKPILNKETIATFISCFMALLRMGEEYKVTSRLRGKVHLIRAKTVDEMDKSLGDDFSLRDVCDGGVALSWVDGDHESFLQNESAVETANIITKAWSN